jgi:O-antigen/teichoic acid export membrane protein
MHSKKISSKQPSKTKKWHSKTRQHDIKQSQGRWGQWAKLIAITGSAQVIVQAVGFLCGIVVIRLLPTHEYALYTLANTMLGTMAILANGGIATGVMSQSGKVWQDKKKLGAVLVTGMQLRKKFAVLSLIVTIPILCYLLHKHDASWLMSGLIVLSLIPVFFTNLSGSLLEIAPKLQQDIAPLQKIQVVTNISRLALLGLTLLVYPFAAVAIASAGGSQLWSNWRLRKIANHYADRAQPVDPVVRKEILRIVKRIMPGAVYFCISGQITIWLISIFGTTEALAQIGALGRLAMILSMVSIILSTLIYPRFARLPNNRKLLITRFLQIEAALIVLSAGIIVIVWLFPVQILWVLGGNYSKLTVEIVLMAIGSCMTLLHGSAFSLCTYRGHVIRPSIDIALTLASQILLIYIIGYSSVQDILFYSIGNGIIQYVMWFLYFLIVVQKKNIDLYD